MKHILDIGKVRWIHLASPSKEEIKELVKEYEFHEIIEEDIEEMNAQPKIDQYDDTFFIILNFPKFDVRGQKYTLNEFNIILGKDYIITLARYEATHIEKIIEQYKQDLAESDTHDDEAYKVSPYYILYTIIDSMYDKTLKAQEKTSKDILVIEEQLVSSKKQDKSFIEELMKKKASLVLFKYTFLPQRSILREMQKSLGGFYEGDLDVYFEDLESKLDRIINTTGILYETVQSLATTYDTLTNNQMNAIMRLLTLLTAISAVLSLLMSFYSMNIQVPLMKSGSARRILLLMMVALIFGMIFLFKKKKWL